MLVLQDGTIATHICQAIGLWLRRRNDRAMLRSLSLHDIHDFCPRHTEAEAEMSKPFWRA